MNNSTPPCYEFDHFCVDGMRRMLSREGISIPLPPKAFETLLALVQNSGRVMTKKELLERIWPDSFVEESNLAQNVFRLRKTLGEEKHEHQFIVTIPGQGYQFVAPVRESQTSADETEPPKFCASRPTVNAQVPASLAVLPFRPLAAQGSDMFFGMGLADALITKLCNLKDLAVRPTSAVLKYDSAQQDSLAIGRELHVESILEGYYQRDEKQLRVSVQLIKVSDGTTLWAARFDDEFTNLFDVQDHISEQVARALTLRLTAEEKERLVKHHTQSLEAYQLYLMGLHFSNQGTLECMHQAVAYFQQSIAIDPEYALPYAGLADAYFIITDNKWDAARIEEGYAKVKAAAQRALELDETNADAHAVLAVVKIKHERNPLQAERLFRHAIELNPNSALTHARFTWFLLAVGRFDEALSTMKRAHQLDPLSARKTIGLGHVLYYARAYDEALKYFDRALSLDPQSLTAKLERAVTLGQMGMPGRAINELLTVKAVYGDKAEYLEALGFLYAADGNEAAAGVLIELERRAESEYVAPFNVAAIYAALAEHDRAFQWLQKPCINWTERLRRLRYDPRFDGLRSDERFADLAQIKVS